MRRGGAFTADYCDADPGLLRAAKYHGEAAGRSCPVCRRPDLVEVTWVYGAQLGPLSGSARAQAQLPVMAHEHGRFTVYVVEVCRHCAWNHMVISFALGDGQPRMPGPRGGRWRADHARLRIGWSCHPECRARAPRGQRAGRGAGRAHRRPAGACVEVAAISALKTFDPPVGAVTGCEVLGFSRLGKHLVLELVDPQGEPLYVVIHLSRAGWARWREDPPAAPAPFGRRGGGRGAGSALALRIVFGAGDAGGPAGEPPGTPVAPWTSPRRAPRSAWRCMWCAIPATCRRCPGWARIPSRT